MIIDAWSNDILKLHNEKIDLKLQLLKYRIPQMEFIHNADLKNLNALNKKMYEIRQKIIVVNRELDKLDNTIAAESFKNSIDTNNNNNNF